MAESLSERHRQIQNLYWEPGKQTGAQFRAFCQIKYLPLPNAVPYLDQALSGARLDCRRDIHQQLIEYRGAAKLYMTV